MSEIKLFTISSKQILHKAIITKLAIPLLEKSGCPFYFIEKISFGGYTNMNMVWDLGMHIWRYTHMQLHIPYILPQLHRNISILSIHVKKFINNLEKIIWTKKVKL